jgi:hypothetical protein
MDKTRVTWTEEARERDRVYRKEWATKNHDKYLENIRNYRRMKKYGVTPAQWIELLRAQEGACALCLQTVESLCVDHDHETGEVRGLLCKSCNLVLGHLDKDPDLLGRIVAYLKRTM